MSLRLKLSIFMLGIAVFVVGILFYASRVLVSHGFDRLEISSTEQNVQRGTDALANSLNQLSTKLSDWSNWDDAYTYVLKPNKDFEESNLQDLSLTNLKLDYMLFYNAKHELVTGRSVDMSHPANKGIPKSLQQYLSANDNALLKAANEDDDNDDGKRGVVILPEGPLLIAARPIHNSEAGGPSHGVLVFAQYLAPQQATLANITHLKLDFYAANSPDLPDDVKKIQPVLATSQLTARTLTSDKIAGYGTFKDIRGDPTLIVRVQEARSIHAQGLKVANYYSLYLSIAALIVCSIFVLFINITVIQRVASLSRQVTTIDTLSGDLKQVTAVGGKGDEVSALSQSINMMLKRLYDSRFLEQKNIKLNEQIAEATKALEEERVHLNEQLADAQRINRIMVNRELKMVELKKRLAKYEPKSQAATPDADDANDTNDAA